MPRRMIDDGEPTGESDDTEGLAFRHVDSGASDADDAEGQVFRHVDDGSDTESDDA